MKETLNGTTTYKGSKTGLPGLPDRETDVGGYESYPTTSRASDFDSDKDGLPDWFEKAIGTSPTSAGTNFADANADPDGDGWTNLEDYLDWMATPHGETDPGQGISFQLTDLFTGYTKSPAYSVATNSCLTTSLSGSTLKVTPTKACGFQRLEVTVKDSENSTKTRDILVYAKGTVGVGGRAKATAMQWSIDSRRIGVTTDEAGTLEIRDLSGRVLARNEGIGTLSIDGTTLPSRILVASFKSPSLNDNRILPVLH